MSESVNVEVKRVLYPPAVSKDEQKAEFFVLLTNIGKASGKMNWRPEQGERLTLDGTWGAYQGEKNFKFTSAAPNVPVNPRDQLHYAADRAAGIGPVLEELIWKARGEDWRNVEPGEVKGLTGAKHLSLIESVRAIDMEAEKSQAVAWLMGKGCTIKMSLAAYEQFKKETVGVVQANCFRLAELPNYSFVDVDGVIRENFGIGMNDPRRVRAAILYKLRQMTSGGNTVIRWPYLLASVTQLVGAALARMVSDECAKMFEDGSLVGFAGTQSVSLMDDYQAECEILRFVNGSRKNETGEVK